MADLPIFGVCPNDATSPFMERLTFLTDVLDSENASEQMRGTRLTPRRLFEYEFSLDGDLRRYMESRVFAHGAGLWHLPVWTDGVALAAPLASGSVAVPIDTTLREFVPGFAVIVGSDARYTELLTVSAVSGADLTVEPTVKAWPAGSMVYPSVVARMDGPWTMQAFTRGDEFGIARFAAIQANPYVAASPATMYRSIPVFELCPQANEPTYTMQRFVEIHDNETGIPYQVDVAGMAFPTQTVNVDAEGRAETSELRALVYWLDGMRRVLWLPTFLDDLRVTAAIGALDTQITIAACNYTADVAMAMNRRDIRIETWNGQVFHRRITNCADLGSTELLTLDSALGVAIAAADIKRVCYLQLVRSESDLYEFSWVNGDTIQCGLGLKAVRYDA